MVKGIMPGDLNILRDLKISHRLKARVGALLQKKMTATAAVLETAEPGSDLEKFLLAPELLKSAEILDEKGFQEMVAGYSEDVQDMIAFEPGGENYSVIMLLDEQIAGDIFTEEAPAEKAVAVQTEGSREIADIERLETRAEEQMKNDPHSLRMTILTSPDKNEKIEAIRRMLFSEHDVIEKGDLFFAALGDEDNTVRTEALKALNKIGLDADVADAMQAFCNAGPNMIGVSIKRLAGILKKVSDPEAVIGTRILVSRLKDDVSYESKNAVILTLADVIDKIQTDTEAIREISEQVLRVFIREPEKLESGTETYFRKVLPFKNGDIYEYLYEEQFRVEDVRISSVIASLLFDIESGREKKDRMIENILLNINEVTGLEDGKRRVLNALSSIEDSKVYDSILEHFNTFTRDMKSSVLYFLGLRSDFANTEA